MTLYSTDVLYAYVQLGLDPGQPLPAIEAVLANAIAYRFSTKARLKHVHRFVRFFSERDKFGATNLSFADVKKTYHKMAMELHPDRNIGNKATEDQLKDINSAYGLIDEIYSEARDYYQKAEMDRSWLEEEARTTTEQETPQELKEERTKPHTQARPSGAKTEWVYEQPTSANSIKYLAASIPRFIRSSRLFYLPRKTIIGSRFIKPDGSIGIVYDIVMLPEREFMRASLYLGSDLGATPELRMSRISPNFVPRDTKIVYVARDEDDPEAIARDFFIKEFGLET